MDADGGGVADLQTDVMRFMAILSLCLVAIFALVQSIPPAPEQQKRQPSKVESDGNKQLVPVPTVTSQKPVEVELIRPDAPVAKTPVDDEVVALQRPVIQKRVKPRSVTPATAIASTPSPPPAAPSRSSAPTKDGFTLRFENDLALTELVTRNEVGLYAITPDRSLRINIERGNMSFWQASTPTQFHEMDSATVPTSIIETLARSNNASSSSAKWAVTIPRSMSQQLNQHMREHSGGSLIISADGDLRLER